MPRRARRARARRATRQICGVGPIRPAAAKLPLPGAARKRHPHPHVNRCVALPRRQSRSPCRCPSPPAGRCGRFRRQPWPSDKTRLSRHEHAPGLHGAAPHSRRWPPWPRRGDGHRLASVGELHVCVRATGGYNEHRSSTSPDPLFPRASGMAALWVKTRAAGLQLCQQPGPKGDAKPSRALLATLRAGLLQVVQIPVAAGKVPFKSVHNVGEPMKIDLLMPQGNEISFGVDRIAEGKRPGTDFGEFGDDVAHHRIGPFFVLMPVILKHAPGSPPLNPCVRPRTRRKRHP